MYEGKLTGNKKKEYYMTYQVNDKLYFVRDMQKGDVVVSGIVVDVGVPKDNKIDYIMQFPEDADPDTNNQLYALTEAEYLEYYKRQPEVAATNKKKEDKHMNNQMNELMEQINRLQEVIKSMQDNNNNVTSNNNMPMMSTGNSSLSPRDMWEVKNKEYRREYDRMMARHDRERYDLHQKYGITHRARPKLTKSRKG